MVTRTRRNELDYGPVHGINGGPLSELWNPADTQLVQAEGTPYWRLPGLSLPSPSTGTILSYCASVSSNLSDYTGWNICVKRSTDNGTTWGPAIVAALSSDTAYDNVTGPSIVVDRNGRFHLLFSAGDAVPNAIYYTYSDTDGLTWEEPTDITLQILIQGAGHTSKAVSGAADNGGGLIRLTTATHLLTTGDYVRVTSVGGVSAANGYWVVTVINGTTIDLQGSTFSGSYTSGGAVRRSAGWKLVANGNHGIEMPNGYLVVPFYYRYALDGSGDAFSAVLISDDGGENWVIAAQSVETTTLNKNAIEPSIVDGGGDGTLIYMSCRHKDNAYRAHYNITDSGDTNGTAAVLDNGAGGTTRIPEATGGGTVGGLVRYNEDYLLMVQAAGPVRSRLTLRASDDDGVTWDAATMVIHWGQVGYSAITVAADGTICIAYERGLNQAGGTFSGKIAYCRLSLNALLNTANLPVKFSWPCNEESNGVAVPLSTNSGYAYGATVRDFGRFDQRAVPGSTSASTPPTYATDPSGANTWMVLGSDDYIVLAQADTQALDFDADAADSGNGSIEVDILTNGGTGQIIASNPSGAGWNLEITAGGKAKLNVRDGTNSPSITGGTTINDNAIHRILAIRDKSNNLLRLYVDGVIDAVAVADTTSVTTKNTGAKHVGQFNDTTGHMSASLRIRIPQIVRGLVTVSAPDLQAPRPFPSPARLTTTVPANSPASISGLRAWFACTCLPHFARSDFDLSNPLPPRPANGFPINSFFDASGFHYFSGNGGYHQYRKDGLAPGMPFWWFNGLGRGVLDASAITAWDFIQNTKVFTIAFWGYQAASQHASILDTKDTGNGGETNGFYLSLSTTPTLSIRQSGSTTDLAKASGGTTLEDAWYHCAWVSSGAGAPCTCYITPFNVPGTAVVGGASGNNVAATGSFATSVAAVLGDRSAQDRRFIGGLKDLVIYNAALSSGNIQTLYDFRL